MVEYSDRVGEIKSCIAKWHSEDVGLNEMHALVPPDVLVRGVDSGGEVDSDNLTTVVGGNVGESSGSDPRIEHEPPLVI